MYTKLSILALCAAASVSEAAAGSIHRHMHPKKDVVWAATDTVVVTEYVTMTVTEGEVPATQAAQTYSAESKPNKQGGHQYPEQPAPAPAISSTTISVPAIVPTSTPTVPAAEPSYPVSSPTTLATSVKPSSVAVVESPATSSVVESPVVNSPVVEYYQSSAAQTPAASTSTTAPAPSSTSSKPASGSGASKRGAAYNDPSLVRTLLGLSNKVSWAYNWGSDPGNLDAQVAYYPMLWSPASEHSSNWDAKAEAAIAKGSDCILSFNEPDIPSQANISPAVAAAGHIQFMNKYAGRVRVSAPAVSSSESAGQGLDWLGQFFASCDGKCEFDFCAAHWYGPGGADGADLFLAHVQKVHDACQKKPVWVTEFGAVSGDVDAFMSAVTQKLDGDEYGYVEKYSYFMLNEGSLMADATSLSSFGKIFAGVA
ncbi:hypothetical protein AAE478_005402 [Parahypoxylon ruwenzoriense]